MASEPLMDLIRQVQRSTRAESGLPHYDPNGTHQPPLPSISETVSSLDPSPPHLRCKNCKGRLLRGEQSMLCVYCGRPSVVVRDPICFKDTAAYRWLLESLQLDASEIVGPPSEKGDSHRGQTTQNEIHLFDLLDFKITWPAEEKRGNNLSSENPEERSFLKFSGLDLDNFFYESRSLDDASKPEENKVIGNVVATAGTKVDATNNLSFFENVPSSESIIESSKDKDHHAYSGWEADFQSANKSESFASSVDSAVERGNNKEISEQPDTVSGSQVDLSSHLDTVFGSVKDSNSSNLRDNSAPSSSAGDWTSDDTWSNFRSESSQDNKQPDSAITAKDALPQDHMYNVDLSYQLDSIFGFPNDSRDRKEKDDSTSRPFDDWSSDNLWNNLSSETSLQMEPPDATGRLTDALPEVKKSSPSPSFDWFQGDQWENTTNATTNNMISEEDVSINDWDNFTSSIPVQDSSGNASAENHKQSIAVSESTSELKLFNLEDNFDDMNFGSFSQADSLPSSSRQRSDSKELNDFGSEVAASDRAVYMKSQAHEGVLQSDTSKGVKIDSTSTKNDVEMLLSQMRDLSFMLEDKLSIPRKPDGPNSF